jgi:hypothetical protein
MNHTGKGIILGVLGAGIAVSAVGAIDALYNQTPEEVENDESVQDESQFLGEAARSFGMIAGVLVFLLIFLVLAGIALVIYGANKAAQSGNTFDENARRTDKIIDIALKTKALRK